jgi:hypothetical protein
MYYRKSFPSPHIFYHIKAPLPNGGYGHLCADINGYLCPSTVFDQKIDELFKFEKDSDGTISICSMLTVILNTDKCDFFIQNILYLLQGKYLEMQTYICTLVFRAKLNNRSKFTLIFHPQQDKQQPGILVDILSLANSCFLSVEVNPADENYVLATSPTPPANKFLILAEGVDVA